MEVSGYVTDNIIWRHFSRFFGRKRLTIRFRIFFFLYRTRTYIFVRRLIRLSKNSISSSNVYARYIILWNTNTTLVIHFNLPSRFGVRYRSIEDEYQETGLEVCSTTCPTVVYFGRTTMECIIMDSGCAEMKKVTNRTQFSFAGPTKTNLSILSDGRVSARSVRFLYYRPAGRSIVERGRAEGRFFNRRRESRWKIINGGRGIL